MAGKGRRYAPEFKARMVELVRAGRSADRLAREFDPLAPLRVQLLIPTHADHRFRFKPITDSDACRSLWSERVGALDNPL